ncbi:DUF5686 family protein, partial [bacterium]
MAVEDIIEHARQYLDEGYYLMEDYACSTRTSTFMKQELLDVIQRYDINTFAFTPVDDWAEGAVFWKKPDKFKYRVDAYYRSQTWGDTVFAPVKIMSSSLNGPFIFEKFNLVSPLSDSCFMYYDYQLLSVVTIDYIKKCYEIAVIPKKKNPSLVSGVIRIEDQHFSVMDMTISFSRKTKMLIPLHYECEIKFLQWQERYNLCYQMVIHYELILPKLSRVTMLQKVDYWDFAVNTGLQDTLFDKKKLDYREAEAHLSDRPFSLTSLSQQMESQASREYKFSGRFASLTSIWDILTLNRVEGIKTSLGIRTEGRFHRYWRLGLNIGYGWSDKRTGARFDFGHYTPRGTGFSFGAAWYDGVASLDQTIMTKFANSFSFLVSSNDYLDY